MDSAWIQRPVKLIQSDSDGVIIIQTDSDKFQKNSDRFSLIQNFLFMRGWSFWVGSPTFAPPVDRSVSHELK